MTRRGSIPMPRGSILRPRAFVLRLLKDALFLLLAAVCADDHTECSLAEVFPKAEPAGPNSACRPAGLLVKRRVGSGSVAASLRTRDRGRWRREQLGVGAGAWAPTLIRSRAR